MPDARPPQKYSSGKQPKKNVFQRKYRQFKRFILYLYRFNNKTKIVNTKWREAVSPAGGPV